jgi:hypothetical protein
VRRLSRFFRRYVPGFESSYNIQSGVTVCVRETRRIAGEYRLTADDIRQARKFEDTIALGTYPMDIHSPTGKGTILEHVPAGQAYGIPLRCLIPRRIGNLLVAGRCISGSHEAQSSYRVMAISMATGQAAGICAALAARESLQPREVPFGHVQEEIVRQGGIIMIGS